MPGSQSSNLTGPSKSREWTRPYGPRTKGPYRMQTFLPYASFALSARCLDRQRLGKQRVEAKQILLALRTGGAWANHPATRMWRGHEASLATYGATICVEWKSRGYQDSLLPFFTSESIDNADTPPWLGYEPFHASHRSNLLRKLPSHYSQFNWSEPPLYLALAGASAEKRLCLPPRHFRTLPQPNGSSSGSQATPGTE
jgi:hypothetical protein